VIILSVNKILISALALFIGLGIMASAGSILNDAERYLKEITITDIDIDSTTAATTSFTATDYISTLDAEYLYNNFEDLYSFTIIQGESTYEIIANGSIIDNTWTFGTGIASSVTITKIPVKLIEYNIGGTYLLNLEEYGFTFDGEYINLDSNSALTLEFTWQLEQYTTLGRLTNVATITMVIAILSTATYFTLKGRAKA
jgi:hypothetical protein